MLLLEEYLILLLDSVHVAAWINPYYLVTKGCVPLMVLGRFAVRMFFDHPFPHTENKYLNFKLKI